MLWRYWDWEIISKKYVKHFSRIIFLFLSLFLIYSIKETSSFDVLKVYNFTNKRPELIEVYGTIIIPALYYLKKAFTYCLISVPILILLTWIPDIYNSRFCARLYNFTLILFALVNATYMLTVIFFLKATSWWFIYFVTVILLVIATLIINHIYYKLHKESFKHISIGYNILLAIIVIFTVGLEVFLAYPKVVDARSAMQKKYETVCDNFKSNVRSNVFCIILSENNLESEKYLDIDEAINKSTEYYVALKYVNYYNTYGYTFTTEEILDAFDALDEANLDTNSDSWYLLFQLYDADSTVHNSLDLLKYNLKGNNVIFAGWTSKESFAENVFRRLNELGYNSFEEADLATCDAACEYVYNTFESGKYDAIEEVTINITESGVEYVVSVDENEEYFLHYFEEYEDNDGILKIKLYHTVGYYFNEDTVININGIDNYTISNIYLDYENLEYSYYPDMQFDVEIR